MPHRTVEINRCRAAAISRRFSFEAVTPISRRFLLWAQHHRHASSMAAAMAAEVVESLPPSQNFSQVIARRFHIRVRALGRPMDAATYDDSPRRRDAGGLYCVTGRWPSFGVVGESRPVIVGRQAQASTLKLPVG